MLPNTPAPETGRECDRLDVNEINLACANRTTLERMQARLRESQNPQLNAAADLIDEAGLYLSLAISGHESPDYPNVPW